MKVLSASAEDSGREGAGKAHGFQARGFEADEEAVFELPGTVKENLAASFEGSGIGLVIGGGDVQDLANRVDEESEETVRSFENKNVFGGLRRLHIEKTAQRNSGQHLSPVVHQAAHVVWGERNGLGGRFAKDFEDMGDGDAEESVAHLDGADFLGWIGAIVAHRFSFGGEANSIAGASAMHWREGMAERLAMPVTRS
jgi:hypothetical protein